MDMEIDVNSTPHVNAKGCMQASLCSEPNTQLSRTYSSNITTMIRHVFLLPFLIFHFFFHL